MATAPLHSATAQWNSACRLNKPLVRLSYASRCVSLVFKGGEKMINTNQSGVFDDNALDVLDELCWAFHHKHLDPNDFPKLDKLAH